MDHLIRNPDSEIEGRLRRKITFNKRDRINYLWAKLRVYTKIIGRLIKLNKDIKTYGSSKGETRDHLVKVLTFRQKLDSCSLILPRSSFKIMWDFFIMLLLIYTATVMPYRMCFISVQSDNWLYSDLIVDTFFFCDIIFNFNTALISANDKLIHSRALIAKKYLKSWFLIDFFSCLPLEIIDLTSSGSGNYNKFLRFFRMTKIYRIIRIIKLLKLVRFFNTQYVNSMISMIKINNSKSKAIGFCFILTVSVHVLSCFWYYIGTLGEGNIMNWIDRYHVRDKSDFERYLISIYFVFTTLTTIGYGDIVAVSNIEKCFAIVLMGFGACCYSYLIGSLANTIKSQDVVSSNLKAKFKGLKDFARAINLDHSILVKIKKTIKMNKKRHYQENVDVSKIIKDLPYNLREEILNFLNLSIVQGIFFFQDKPSSFVNHMVPHLKLSYYQFSNILYEEDELAEELYFIKIGKVFLKVQRKIIFRVYFQGSCFGEIELLENTHRDSAAAIASNIAEIYALSKEEFINILNEYPEEKELIIKIAEAKKIKQEESKAEALLLMEDEEQSNSLMTESISESLNISSISEGSNKASNHLLRRIDTGVIISYKNDTAFKRKNRKIWSHAVGRHTKNQRAKTLIAKDFLLPKKKLKSQKSLTNPEQKVKSPKLFANLARKITFFAAKDEEKKIEQEISPIMKDEDEYFTFNEDELGISVNHDQEELIFKINCNNTLVGVRERGDLIEDKVISMQIFDVYRLAEDISVNNKDISEMIVKLKNFKIDKK